MDKKILLNISTDWHLTKDNAGLIKDLVRQQCELAKSQDLFEIWCLGDVFESRKAQELSVLDSFIEILDLIHSYKLQLHLIPGNHDKVDYADEISYLGPYFFHPALVLYKKFTKLVFPNNLEILLLPFFQEDKWIEIFEKEMESLKGDKNKKILLTHTAFSNSVNNDGTKVVSKINYQMLKNIDLVLSGHYHDKQQVFKNTFHIPAIKQKNFGENEDKGFTIVYDDLSIDMVSSNFRPFRTFKYDLSEKTLSVIKEEIKLLSENCHTRLELSGPQELLQAFPDNDFKNLGIAIKKKIPMIETSIEYAEEGSIEVLDNGKIDELFEKFANQEGWDVEEGKKYLSKIY